MTGAAARGPFVAPRGCGVWFRHGPMSYGRAEEAPVQIRLDRSVDGRQANVTITEHDPEMNGPA